MMRLLAIDLEYTLLLTTLNMMLTYVAENSQTKRTVPRRYNNIQYCTSKMDV
jgi:hypothetical protein